MSLEVVIIVVISLSSVYKPNKPIFSAIIGARISLRKKGESEVNILRSKYSDRR